MEAQPLDFHERVRAGFLELAAADPERYLVIDATADADAVHAAIRQHLVEVRPMSVYDRLVGQQHVVELLRHAVAGAQDTLDGQPGHAMTHAWLFTGPPGSGRSTAARIFAAALQCLDGGCDHCQACRTAMRGTHADVHVVATEGLSIKVDEVRELVLEASAAPTQGRWRVIIIEDADRLTEQANNALLKTLEEPVPHTVWLLCAPSVEDLLPTIRSRTRQVQLVTPSAGRGRGVPGESRRRRPGDRRLRRPRVTRPHRSRPRSGHGRSDPPESVGRAGSAASAARPRPVHDRALRT